MVKSYFKNIFEQIEAQPSNQILIKETAKDIITSLTPLFEQNKQLIYQGLLEELIDGNRLIDLIDPKPISPFKPIESYRSHKIVYFMQEVLKDKNISIEGKTCVVSGTNEEALHTMRKLEALKVKLIACSDEIGALKDPYGLDIDLIETLRNSEESSLQNYTSYHPEAIYVKNPSHIWRIPCQLAFTCAATLELDDARQLIQGGIIALSEGCNMAISLSVSELLTTHKVLFSPFNATKIASHEPHSSMTDLELQAIMKEAYTRCKRTSAKYGCKDQLTVGTNIISFEWASKPTLAYC